MTYTRTRSARTAMAVVTALAVISQSLFVLSALPARAATASLYLSPSSKSVETAASFTETLYVGTDVAINSAEATVTFPKGLLKVTSVSSSGIFSLWANQPSSSNAAGTVSFAGGLPTPGYKGTSGKIITITFKALAEGTATVAVTNGQVLANDGQGTNILKSQRTASIKITKPATPTNTNTNSNVNTNVSPPVTAAPTFESTTNPSQDAWYKSKVVSASWHSGAGVQGYSTVFDTVADTVPPETVTSGVSNYTKDDVSDGIWYVHVRAKYATGWSATAHYRFQIDATAPLPFTIAIEGDPTLSFETSDETSGIDHYELSLDDGDYSTVTSPYVTPTLEPGSHSVRVRAYDKAGNVTESSATFEVIGYPQPILIDLTPVLFGNKPLVIRGLSNAQDSIRLTIDGVDYGPYAVSEYADQNPSTTVPEGKVAWRIEVSPNVSSGEHTITMTAIGADGRESSITPPVRFKIVTNVVQLYNLVIPVMLIVNILCLLVVLLVAVGLFYAIRYYRLRRHLHVSMRKPDILNASQGELHIHSTARPLSEDERLENILIDHSKQGIKAPDEGKKGP